MYIHICMIQVLGTPGLHLCLYPICFSISISISAAQVLGLFLHLFDEPSVRGLRAQIACQELYLKVYMTLRRFWGA